jgi:hypothetical protein
MAPAAVRSVAPDPSVTSRSVAALSTWKETEAKRGPPRSMPTFSVRSPTLASSRPPETVAPVAPPRFTLPPSAESTPPALSTVAPFSIVIVPPPAEIVPRFVTTTGGTIRPLNIPGPFQPIARLPRSTRNRPRFTNEPGSARPASRRSRG